MTAHVALLRGIGPGNPKMRNAALKSVFEQAGFEGVRTVISSGNVIFESAEPDRAVLEDRIEGALQAHLGRHCSAIVRTRRQLVLLAGLDVFDAFDDSPSQRCNVTFLKRRAHTDLDHLGGSGQLTELGAEVVGVRNQAIFTVFDTTRGDNPKFLRDLERALGSEITMRTWRTVHRITSALRDDRG